MSDSNRILMARRQDDAAEFPVVEFQGIPGLLNEPVADTRPGGLFREKGFDFRPPQVPPPPAGKADEKAAHPADAVWDGLFLGSGLAQRGHIALGPLGLGVDRRRDGRSDVRHSNPSLSRHYVSHHQAYWGEVNNKSRHSILAPVLLGCYF